MTEGRGRTTHLFIEVGGFLLYGISYDQFTGQKVFGLLPLRRHEQEYKLHVCRAKRNPHRLVRASLRHQILSSVAGFAGAIPHNTSRSGPDGYRVNLALVVRYRPLYLTSICCISQTARARNSFCYKSLKTYTNENSLYQQDS